MSKKSLIITYILAIVCATLLSTLEYPTPYHLPIGIIFLFVYPIIIIQIEKRKTHNKKIELAEKNIEFIQNFGLPLFYIFFIAMFSFVNIGYYSGKACINDTYAVAVVKTPEKAGQIQTLLTKPDRSTGRNVAVNENDEEIGYAITLNKNEVNQKQYYETISELVNSDIMDDSIEIPIDVKITKNPKKMISRVEKALENNIMCIDGITSSDVYVCQNNDYTKVKCVSVYYRTNQNTDSNSVRMKIKILVQSCFKDVDKKNIFMLDRRADDLYRKAREEFINKNYLVSLNLLRQGNKIQSDHTGYKESIEILKKFITVNELLSKNKNNYKLYIERGDLQNYRDDKHFESWAITSNPESAIADYNKALELNPKAYEVYEKRGNAWIDCGYQKFPNCKLEKTEQEYLNAIDDYKKAIELTGGNDILYGKIAALTKTPEERLKYYEKIKNPYNEDTWRKIPQIPYPEYGFSKTTYGYIPLKMANDYASLKQYDKSLKILDEILIQTKDENLIQQTNNMEFYYNWKAGHYKTALKNADNCSVWVCKLAGIFF